MSCPHGMPTPGSCVDCMMDGPVVAPKLGVWRVETTFRARHEGYCRGCGEAITLGQVVQKWTKNLGLFSEESCYLHKSCGPPAAT